MWILLTEKDTVQPGDEYYDEESGRWLPVCTGDIGGRSYYPNIGSQVPYEVWRTSVRRQLTGWDAVEHVIDTEIPADSTQALKCLVRMLRAKTAPIDP